MKEQNSPKENKIKTKQKRSICWSVSLISLLSCRLEEIMVVAARTRCRTIGVTSPCLLQDLRGKTRFTWRPSRNLHDVLLIKPVNMQKDLSIDYYPHQGDRCANISSTWYAHIHVLYIEKMLYRVMSLMVNIKSDKSKLLQITNSLVYADCSPKPFQK